MLMNATNAMLEFRLKIEYGDYLAVNCATLKEHQFQGFKWKETEGLDWGIVADALKKENVEMEEWRKTQKPPRLSSPRPATPWMDDLKRAADRLNTTKERLLFEIQFYAERNGICHSGIKALVENCNWTVLAERISQDKKVLGGLYKDHPEDSRNLRTAIERIQSRWYIKIIEDPPQVIYLTSEEAVLKTHAREKRKDAAKKALSHCKCS